MPPISIASDSDLTQFRKKRLLFDDLNIYVAFRNIASRGESSRKGKCFSSEFDDSVIDDDVLLAFVEGVETYYRQNLQLNQGLNSRPNGEIELKRKAVGGDSLFQGGNGPQSEIVFEEDVCKLVDSSESVSVASKRSRKQVGLSLEGSNASSTMELRGSVVVGVGDIVGISEDDPDYAFHALASLIDRDLQQSPTQSGQSKECLVSGEAPVHCTSKPSLLEVEPLGFSLGLDEDKAEGTPIPNNPVHQETMVRGSIFELGGPSRECLSNIPSCSLSPPSLITPLAEANKAPTIKLTSSSAIMSSSYVEEDVMNVGSVFFSDDEDLLDDGVPVLDNMVAPSHDERNMGLKMAGDALYVGRIFPNKEELNKFLSVYAMKRLFCYRVTKSDTARLIANCVDHNCSWRVYAISHRFSENFEIRTLHLKHNCDIASRSRYGEKATSRVLADLIQSKFANGKKGPRACELPDMLLAELKVSVSYMKAWHAKELAMARSRGNDEESFKFLCTYLHLLQTANPGTLTDIVTSEDRFGKSHFKYLFLAFGASVAGYAFLRKVIIIDGTQLKGKYKGCLVAASCQDGNLQIFPLAFGVVDGENEAAWVWFFQNLAKVVPDDEELVFVSDRHPAIYAGLQKVFPTAHHAACTVHLCRNVNHRFKNEGLAAVVSKAARAYTVGDFRYWWAEIEKRSLACAQYLLKIGLPHWALSHFPGCRYNIMSSNISESLNSVVKKAIDYPLVSMLEFIRMKLMRWFSVRREKFKRD